MKLLISFCNIDSSLSPFKGLSPLGLLDTETDTFYVLVVPVAPDSIGMTGLTQDDAYVYATYQSHAPGIVVFSKYDLQVQDVIPLEGLSDTHSMCIQGKYIYVVSTGTDRIARYIVEKGKIQKQSRTYVWKPMGSEGKTNMHHVNAVISEHGKILASAFGPNYGSMRSSAKHGYIIDIKNNVRVLSKIYHPHAPLLVDNILYYCESATKTVFKNHSPLLRFMSGYIRGLVKDNDTFVVGVSSFRKTSKSMGIAVNPFDVGGALQKMCRVIVANFTNGIDAFPLVYHYDLSRFYNEIYDIILLPGSLEPHPDSILASYTLKKLRSRSLVDGALYRAISSTKE